MNSSHAAFSQSHLQEVCHCLPGEEDIISSWQGAADRVLLTVICSTYNHESYIADAIKGFLIQKTDFPFQVIIHDDASTDSTADVVRFFEKRFPKIIKGIYQEQNLYSSGVSRFSYIRPLLKGEYLAICEGDDYWTDPLKLSKQVRFLEDNPAYVMTFHNHDELSDEGVISETSKKQVWWKRDFSSDEMIRGEAHIPTLTRVLRRSAWEFPPERYRVAHGDRFSITMLGLHGHAKYMPDVEPAVYRRHGAGMWSGANQSTRDFNQFITFLWIYRYLSRLGQTEHLPVWERRLARKCMDVLPQRELLRELARMGYWRLRNAVSRLRFWRA